MLILLLAISMTWAAPTRANSGERMRAGCLRSEVHQETDQRRAICDCIVRTITADRKITDAEFAYLAQTWESPKKKIKNAPKEADILEDYDEDVMESCMPKPKG